MDEIEELLRNFSDPSIPDKRRILRTRALATEVAGRLVNPGTRRRVQRSLNDAYLSLQLATLAEEPTMARRCRRHCAALIAEIARDHRAARRPDCDGGRGLNPRPPGP